MPLRVPCLVVSFTLLLGFVPGKFAHAAAQDAQAFDEGISAFRAQDYEAALRSFLGARQAGMDVPALRYNLGATYYRLGRYEEAEREFLGLMGESQWAALAHYNLGLTAQRAGRRQQAIERFEEARRRTADPNLRSLAATAIGRLGAPPPSRTSAVASLAGGYDSNVALASGATSLATSNRSDSFAESLAAVSHRLVGNAAGGWHAHGGLVLRGYRDLREFDLSGLRAGLSRETESSGVQTSVGAYLDTVHIGGDPFERTAVLDAQARGRLDAGGELRGRYQLGHIAGGAGFEYLDGWQQRFSGEAGFGLPRASIRAGYELELNNRADFQQGSDFSSYSPTQHSLFATLVLHDVGGWRTELRGEYRKSRYDDTYRLNVGTLEVTRKEDLYGIAARANRRLSALWRVFVDYSYYRNKSTLDTYDYDRHQLMAGVEAALEE